MSARCFLHYLHKRDNNVLAWEAQDQAAAQKIGASTTAEQLTASDWMRIYFGHARAINRVCLQSLYAFPAAPSSLHGEFQNLQSRFANPEFLVENGLISLQQPDAVGDSDLLMRSFRFRLATASPSAPQPKCKSSRLFRPSPRIRLAASKSGITCRKFSSPRTLPKLCAPCIPWVSCLWFFLSCRGSIRWWFAITPTLHRR